MIDTQAVRNKILNLAFQGKLLSQATYDYSVKEILDNCKSDKEQAIKEGKCKKESFRGPLEISDYPFDIPENWAFVYISDMALFQEGPGILGKDFRENGVPLIRIAGMQGNKVSKIGCNYLDPDMVAKKWNHFKLDVGDIVISTSASLDKIAEVEEDTAGCIAYTGLIRFKMYGGIDKEYFKYYIKSPFYVRQIENQITGVAISHYGPTHLKKMVIPIPPLAEQNKIVSELDITFNELKLIDDLQQQYANNIISLNKKILDLAVMGKLVPQDPNDEPANVLLKKIAEEKLKLIKEGKIKKQKALPAIMEDEIPFDIPESWEWVRLDSICAKITSGSTPAGGKKSNAYVEEGFPFFREQNVYNDGIREKGLVYITEELLNTRANSTVVANDILLNITGGSIGRCALISNDFDRGSINQHILIIRNVNPALKHYIHLCLCSPYFQRQIMGNVVGDKDGFSAGRCRRTLVPIPPLEEQKRIVHAVRLLSEQINSLR